MTFYRTFEKNGRKLIIFTDYEAACMKYSDPLFDPAGGPNTDVDRISIVTKASRGGGGGRGLGEGLKYTPVFVFISRTIYISKH